MKKIIVVSVILVLSFVACQPKNNLAEVEVSSYAQQLFESKNPYIGDASANGEILSLLNISEEMGSYSVELKADEAPYLIKLNFKDYVNDRDNFDLKILDKAFLILALIDNLDEVQFSYPHIKNGEETLITVYVTKQQATDILKKDIKSYAKSEEGLQELLNQLNN